jgi:hypothetical protein
MNNLVNVQGQWPVIVNQNMQYGGIQFTIQITPEIEEVLRWVSEYKLKIEKEEKLRQTVPALANQWEQYQTMLKIVMDDV